MQRFRLISILAVVVLVTALALAPRALPVQAQATPTMRITAPAAGATVANPVSVTVDVAGATIKDPTQGDANASHLHYFVDRDPATVVRPGQPIPTGQPDIIHSPQTTLQLPTLSPGRHTVWVVLSHNDHTPYSPNVQADVSFTVGNPNQASASPAGAAQAQPNQLPTTGDDVSRVVLAMAVGGLVLCGLGLALLRRTARS